MPNFSDDNDLIHRHARESANAFVTDATEHLKQRQPSAMIPQYQQLLAAQALSAAILEASVYISRAIEDLASALRENDKC